MEVILDVLAGARPLHTFDSERASHFGEVVAERRRGVRVRAVK